MNKSVKEEIEKGYEFTLNNTDAAPCDSDSFLIGAKFGFNLAIEKASVLREALDRMLASCRCCDDGDNYADCTCFDYVETRALAREALEQFDKLVGKE